MGYSSWEAVGVSAEVGIHFTIFELLPGQSQWMTVAVAK